MNNKIKLKNINWEVNIDNTTNSAVLDGNLGMCVYDQNELHVACNIKEDSMIETFYHELSHAILAETGYNSDIKTSLGDNYEKFIDRLGDVIQNINQKEIDVVLKRIKNIKKK